MAQKMNLTNVGGGVAEELFANELEKIIDNILDPNIKAEDKRKIILEFEFKPGENRDFSKILITCKSKLADPIGYQTLAVIGNENGRGKIIENRQLALFDDKEQKMKVIREEG